MKIFVKRVSVELFKRGVGVVGVAPTSCVIECFVLGFAQTHLLFSHKKSMQKKLLTAVPTLSIARTSSALLSLKRHSQGSTHRADPLGVLVR